MAIKVWVAYATPAKQVECPLEIQPGVTVRDAIQQSGILATFPEMPFPDIAVGIFSEPVSLDTVLQAGDRVEIYRPLAMDPKEARRRRQ